MLIRVRSNVGVWRVEGLEPSSKVQDILKGIATTRPHVVYEKPLCQDPACSHELNAQNCLLDEGLRHGSMVHCRVDPSSCAEVSDKPLETKDEDQPVEIKQGNMKRIIDKDGSIRLVPTNEVRDAKEDKGFRRGMMPLRDIKMAWTLNEFVAMDSQFVFKVQRQESAVCKQVSLDSSSVGDFQSYLRRFQFSRKRFGYLYGKFEKSEEGDVKAVVEAIYEPPQVADPDAAEGFEMLDDPMEATVEQIAQLCELQKVGWIFGHPPREDGFVLNASEVIMAAEMQLEAVGGVNETPFVTVKVTASDDGNVSVEAFQVSQQCMAMVAEEALEIGPDPGFCNINETFTAIQEGKESKTVNNNFFLTVVPIAQHTSEIFVSQFPKANRDLDDRTQSHDELKRQLSKSGTAGWTFIDLLADFNLLIYLAKFLDVEADFPKICRSITDRSVPIDDGYKIIITGLAGVDTAY
mmetsp:Transcript_28985/g.70006  ORF Transcript_28985/g.70006 Transcript_28985/m.70006 type:complete len:464 (-) Transcript_28985:72-1463(-)